MVDRLNLFPYRIIMFLHYFAQGILVPILSMMLLDRGILLADLALVVGVFSVTAAVLEVPTGILADLIGKKKVYLVSLFITVLSMFVILLGNGVALLIIGIMLFGASRALASGTLEALFLDRYCAAYRNVSKGVRIVTISESFGLAVGSLFGGILPSISARLGYALYDMNLLLRIGFSILIIFPVILLIPTDYPSIPEHARRFHMQIRSSFAVLRDSGMMRIVFLIVMATGFALNYIEAYWQPFFVSLIPAQIDTSVWLGVLSISYFGAVMLGNIISERFLRRSERTKFIYLLGRIGMIFFLVLCIFSKQAYLFFLLFCLTYLSFGFANVAEGTIINSRLNESNRASVLSMQSLILQAGVIFGAILSKFLPQTVTIRQLWMIAVFFLGVVLFPLLLKKRRS